MYHSMNGRGPPATKLAAVGTAARVVQEAADARSSSPNPKTRRYASAPLAFEDDEREGEGHPTLPPTVIPPHLLAEMIAFRTARAATLARHSGQASAQRSRLEAKSAAFDGQDGDGGTVPTMATHSHLQQQRGRGTPLVHSAGSTPAVAPTGGSTPAASSRSNSNISRGSCSAAERAAHHPRRSDEEKTIDLLAAVASASATLEGWVAPGSGRHAKGPVTSRADLLVRLEEENRELRTDVRLAVAFFGRLQHHLEGESVKEVTLLVRSEAAMRIHLEDQEMEVRAVYLQWFSHVVRGSMKHSVDLKAQALALHSALQSLALNASLVQRLEDKLAFLPVVQCDAAVEALLLTPATVAVATTKKRDRRLVQEDTPLCASPVVATRGTTEAAPPEAAIADGAPARSTVAQSAAAPRRAKLRTRGTQASLWDMQRLRTKPLWPPFVDNSGGAPEEIEMDGENASTSQEESSSQEGSSGSCSSESLGGGDEKKKKKGSSRRTEQEMLREALDAALKVAGPTLATLRQLFVNCCIIGMNVHRSSRERSAPTAGPVRSRGAFSCDRGGSSGTTNGGGELFSPMDFFAALQRQCVVDPPFASSAGQSFPSKRVAACSVGVQHDAASRDDDDAVATTAAGAARWRGDADAWMAAAEATKAFLVEEAIAELGRHRREAAQRFLNRRDAGTWCTNRPDISPEMQMNPSVELDAVTDALVAAKSTLRRIRYDHCRLENQLKAALVERAAAQAAAAALQPSLMAATTELATVKSVLGSLEAALFHVAERRPASPGRLVAAASAPDSVDRWLQRSSPAQRRSPPCHGCMRDEFAASPDKVKATLLQQMAAAATTPPLQRRDNENATSPRDLKDQQAEAERVVSARLQLSGLTAADLVDVCLHERRCFGETLQRLTGELVSQFLASAADCSASTKTICADGAPHATWEESASPYILDPGPSLSLSPSRAAPAVANLATALAQKAAVQDLLADVALTLPSILDACEKVSAVWTQEQTGIRAAATRFRQQRHPNAAAIPAGGTPRESAAAQQGTLGNNPPAMLGVPHQTLVGNFSVALATLRQLYRRVGPFRVGGCSSAARHAAGTTPTHLRRNE